MLMDLDMTWTLMYMNYVTSLIINLCNRNVFNAGKHYKATPKPQNVIIPNPKMILQEPADSAFY